MSLSQPSGPSNRREGRSSRSDGSSIENPGGSNSECRQQSHTSERRGTLTGEVAGHRDSLLEYDLSADLTELRAKYEQRRSSEYDDARSVLTATQIASMLDGDTQVLSADLAPMGGAPGSRTAQHLAELKQRMSRQERLAQTASTMVDRHFLQPYVQFQERKFLFDPNSSMIMLWDLALSLLALYNAVYMPLELAMPAAGWPGHKAFETLLDVIFMLDVCLRFRVTYRHHGDPVFKPGLVRKHYLTSWFAFDALFSLPLNLIFGVPALALLKAGRICYWRHLRKLDRLAGTSWMRIVQVELAFLLVAHYFGLLYHVVSIVPFIENELNLSRSAPPPIDQKRWIFLPGNEALIPDGSSTFLNEYVCALYWALAAMTAIKGFGSHETRECFEINSEILSPVGERLLTIACFIFGAMVYASIYGNIGAFLQALDSGGVRYRKRMSDMNEFFKYHSVPSVLQKRVRNYVEFQFSMTKGIDVEGFNNALPAHLQLELFLHLNRRMVEGVPLFTGMPSTFIKSIVLKLRPAMCIAGDMLFSSGDPMEAMYFVKRGFLHIIRNKRMLRSVSEGSFLGEMALIRWQAVRTVDVRSVTDSILLALDVSSFQLVVNAHSESIAGDNVKSILKRNAYTRYNVRLSDEDTEELVSTGSPRRGSFKRKLSSAVHTVSVLAKLSNERRSSEVRLTPPISKPGVHTSDMAEAAASSLSKDRQRRRSREFSSSTAPAAVCEANKSRPGSSAKSVRGIRGFLFGKSQKAKTNPALSMDPNLSDEGVTEEQIQQGAVREKRGSLMGGTIAGGLAGTSAGRRSSSVAPAPCTASMRCRGRNVVTGGPDERYSAARPDAPSTTTATSSSSSSRLESEPTPAMPGRVRRKSRESYGGDSAWTQEAMEEITATRPALKRASRGRASLAETWALSLSQVEKPCHWRSHKADLTVR